MPRCLWMRGRWISSIFWHCYLLSHYPLHQSLKWGNFVKNWSLLWPWMHVTLAERFRFFGEAFLCLAEILRTRITPNILLWHAFNPQPLIPENAKMNKKAFMVKFSSGDYGSNYVAIYVPPQFFEHIYVNSKTYTLAQRFRYEKNCCITGVAILTEKHVFFQIHAVTNHWPKRLFVCRQTLVTPKYVFFRILEDATHEAFTHIFFVLFLAYTHLR